jgi:hypothetical protein
MCSRRTVSGINAQGAPVLRGHIGHWLGGGGKNTCFAFGLRILIHLGESVVTRTP